MGLEGGGRAEGTRPAVVYLEKSPARRSRTRSISLLWCAPPDDMQPATTERASVVLKLGQYVARCLTAAQPDLWFLFLYKCGQLVAFNLHEPVARSVGILDELFQVQQHHGCSGCPTATAAATIGSLPSTSQRPIAAAAAAVPRDAFRPPTPGPDNDQYRGMDEDDDTDGDGGGSTARDDDDDTDSSEDDPFVLLTGRRSAYTSSGRRNCSTGSSPVSARRRTGCVAATGTTGT